MRPSGKFSKEVTQTPEHDRLQLWVSENRQEVCGYVSEFIHGNGHFEVHHQAQYKLQMEYPIYNNNFLVGIVDGIIDINDRWYVETEEFEKKYPGSFDDHRDVTKNVYMPNEIYRRIIYDIKPHLDSISQLIGQLKSYSGWLKYYPWEWRGIGGGGHNCIERSAILTEPFMCVITLDPRHKYDSMLREQNIIPLHLVDGYGGLQKETEEHRSVNDLFSEA